MADYDVIVIGGGAAGEVAAGRLGDGGRSVAIIEKELVGGECTYWACMPSKALLRPTEVFHQTRMIPALMTSDDMLDAGKVLETRDRLASHWSDDAQVEWLDQHDVTLIRGEGCLVGERRVVVTDSDGSENEIEASIAVIVATGSNAVELDVKGADEVDIWSSRGLTSAKSVPESLLIVGGGAVGVEMGQAWSRLGSTVTIVERNERLLSNEEPFVGEELMGAFSDEGITVLTQVSVETIRPASSSGVIVTLSDGADIEVEQVASAIGRRATTSAMGLELFGQEPGEFIEVDDHLRALIAPEWLYGVGDVNGRQLLTHMGKAQARIAADVILGRDVDGIDAAERAVPRVVFTSPMVAAAGMTVADAEAAGLKIQTRRKSFGQLGEAAIWGKGTDGTAHILVHDDRIVGVTLTGPAPVAEMIYAFEIAIIAQIPLRTLRNVVPQYPTFSEIWLDLLDP